MSAWKQLFPVSDHTYSKKCNVDLSYNHYLAKKSIRNKPPLDQAAVDIKVPDHISCHLCNDFVPHANTPTCFLCDVTIPIPPLNRYLESKNPHPRDSRIVSLEEPHVYFIDGSCRNVLSSTGFVHAFFPAFDQVATAKKILNSKTFQKTGHRKSHKYYQCKNPEDVIQRWDHWRQLGTDLHDAIERFINGEDYTVCEENKKPFGHFMEFYNDKKFWHWNHLRTEWAIFDEETRLAGKIDYCGIDPVTGYLIILDWKRVGAISDSCMKRWQGMAPDMGFGVCSDLESCKYITYSLQLNTYKWILEKNYNVYVKKMYLVQMHPKLKQPTLYKVPNLQDHVIQMAACRKLAIQQHPTSTPMQSI